MYKTMKIGENHENVGKHPKIKIANSEGSKKLKTLRKIVKLTKSQKNNQSQCDLVDTTVKPLYNHEKVVKKLDPIKMQWYSST